MKRKQHNEKSRKWQARRTRVRKGIGRSDRPWLTVFRSAKHIYAQLVDGESGRTLATASSRSRSIVGDGPTGNVEAAKKVGTAIAGMAREKNIETVVFNRNGFLFHGRVKALAEAAREAGLQF
ncbi:MAG: 50S ribosomal protein L18 [Myxococcota bacterium]|nr:50S ribosomal protein L18 [Myxococcota bacterium]